MIKYLLPILAVVLGFLFVIIFKPKEKNNLKFLLAFSGAFLLGTTVFEFLPEVFLSNSTHQKQIGLFIVLGILIQICLEFFSKGAEHGHVHIQRKHQRFPYVLFISLSIHSLLEGLPLHDHKSVLYGVVVHKIPIAMILTTYFYAASLPKKTIYLFLFLFAIMTPLGAFMVSFSNLSDVYLNAISAIAIGIFLHISTTILFESTEGHKFNIIKLLVIILGFSAAYFV